MVYPDDSDASTTHKPTKAFCRREDKDQVCSNRFNLSVDDARCTDVRPDGDTPDLWYQDAIYFAACRDSRGNPLATCDHAIQHRVYYGEGTIEIKNALDAYAPYGIIGGGVGIHLPSGIWLAGAAAPLETIIRPAAQICPEQASSCGDSVGIHPVAQLSSLVLMNDVRAPVDCVPTVDNQCKPNPMDPTDCNASITNECRPSLTGAAIDHLTLIGFHDDPIYGTNCSPELPEGAQQVIAGVQGGRASGGMNIQDLRIRHVFGNAIDLGVFLAWENPNSTPTVSSTCAAGFDPGCLGHVIKFSGTAASPNHIRWNGICQARFGGITAIGDYNDISENTITDAPSYSITGGHNTTMGVSGGWVGSTHNDVHNNVLSAAYDYAIGTDGSFPLRLSDSIFHANWAEICSRLDAATYTRQCSAGAPSADPGAYEAWLHTHAPNDYEADSLLIMQTLLDMAGEADATNGSAHNVGFIDSLNIYGNTISNATSAISLWRVSNTNIYSNTANRTDHAGTAVKIAESSGNWLYQNTFNGWDMGVQLIGCPHAHPGCSRATSWAGSSYNGIGVQYIPGPPAVFNPLGNDLRDNRLSVSMNDAGFNNSVWNSFVNCCDFSGARTCQHQVSWTSGNSWTSSPAFPTRQCGSAAGTYDCNSAYQDSGDNTCY